MTPTPEILTALGITKEDIITRCAQLILDGRNDDEEYSSGIESAVTKEVKAAVNERLETAIRDHVHPKVAAMMENLVLQETNTWGEKKGTPVTFVEYLVQRAEQSMIEQVNYEGKSKGEKSYGDWSAKSTRIAYMINQHLYINIERAMKEILSGANDTVRKGLVVACKTALANIKIQVATKLDT